MLRTTMLLLYFVTSAGALKHKMYFFIEWGFINVKIKWLIHVYLL